MSNTKYINEKSKELVHKIEREKFKEIFEVLDDDNDGKISYENIEINSSLNIILDLTLKLLEVLTPIFEIIEKEQLELNLEGFIKLLYDHYNNLTIYDKDAIFEFKKYKKINEMPTFTVVII